MDELQPFGSQSRFWLLDPIPPYLNFWPFKTNLVWGSGLYRSFQAVPSGATLRIPVSGSWTLRMRGRTHRIAPGGLFCTMPSEPCEFSQTDPSASWSWRELQFCGPEAEGFLGEFGLSPESPAIVPAEPEAALESLREIHETIEAEGRSPAKMLSLVFELLAACGQGAPGVPKGDSRQELVRKVKLLQESAPFADRGIGELAEELGVERSTLYRAFKAETGVSPHEYLDSLRTHRAEELLCATSLTLSAIAAQCGFSDVKYFIGWFKAKKGLPPGAWRKR